MNDVVTYVFIAVIIGCVFWFIWLVRLDKKNRTGPPSQVVPREDVTFPPTGIKDVVQEEHLRITRAARARALERDFDGELAAKEAEVESWKKRCFELRNENLALQAELYQKTK